MTQPQDRVRIFDRKGLPLAEFRAAVDRSWAIGDEGRAQFEYPTRKTDVVNGNTTQFGNWLLVENNLLPPWVGVIDPPRTWGTRSVTISAYSPERVFSWRRGPTELLVAGSAGTIFATLLEFVNAAETTVIKAGDVWKGGAQREETLNPTPLSEDLLRIFERSGEEYQWRPVINSNGRLVVYADWVRQLGANTGALLQEGKGGGNLEAMRNMLVEDGVIINDLFGYGEGATWKDKPQYIAKNPASVGDYGLRQGSEEYYDVTTLATVQANAIKQVKAQKEPVRTFNLRALNIGSTFANMRLGNYLTVRFQNFRFGYETTVRIVGMAYDTLWPNKIELATEEA